MAEENSVIRVHHDTDREVEEAAEEEVEIVDWERCRARIEHEDKLLNNRANLFLVFNGLAAMAVGKVSNNNGDLLIALLIVTADVLWLVSSLQAAVIMRRLTGVYIKEAHDPVDKVAREALAAWPKWTGSTFIMSLYLPLVLTAGWIIALVV